VRYGYSLARFLSGNPSAASPEANIDDDGLAENVGRWDGLAEFCLPIKQR